MSETELCARNAALSDATGIWMEIDPQNAGFRNVVTAGYLPTLGYEYVPPRFHESHEARAALLEWLMTRPSYVRWDFLAQLAEIIGQTDSINIMAWMLATPAAVAEAAHRVIE